MKWTKRGLQALFAVFVLFVGIVVIRTAQVRPEAKAASPVNLAPAPEIDTDLAAAHLGEAIRIRTISRTEGVVEDSAAFLALRSFLEATYPRLHSALRREVIADYSLLFTLSGLDPSLPPVLLLAHQDVVPVEAGTEGAWEAPPFSGELRDGRIYGRGALDDKGSLVAIMEAMESLLASGFRPRRTIMLAFGHDEETLGGHGAQAIARLLDERGIHPWFVVDEGMFVILDNPLGGGRAIAFIGIAEKGYLTVRITARGEGGHSFMPPSETTAERLSRAILAIRSDPFEGHLDEGPVASMLDALAPHLSFALRAVIANRWAFGPVLRSRMASTAGGNALLRTTIAPTVVAGGTKENILPQEVHALVNLRLHPRDSVEKALGHLRKSVARIEGISIQAEGTRSEPSPTSSTTTDSFALLATLASTHAPEGALVAPVLAPVATDSRYFARLAENVYRFVPSSIRESEFRTTHGTGECLSVENLGRMVRFYAQLMATAGR